MEKQRLVTIPEVFLKGLERKVEDLKTLMEMSAIFSSTLDRDYLISLVMEKAKMHMDAEACRSCFMTKRRTGLSLRERFAKMRRPQRVCRKKALLK
jgi:hypothetical protein